ncbi:MAG: methylmalonyl-CoA mutase family protein [Deltaproteobacteria bacterium]|nr:methylmalonyl-CoA mutase family protein [Deltaproteobacteria bacterium]
MKPDKDSISSRKDWNTKLEKDIVPRQKERKESFLTESGIEIRRLYTQEDLNEQAFDYATHLGFPGFYPFTRSKDPLGYRSNFWIFQQYAGFGDAEEANKRYRFLLDHGQTGMSIALDLPTQIGLDSDNPLAQGEIGKVGVAIDSLEDLETIFNGIPLNKPKQISFVANATALTGLAMFLVLAEKQGIPTDEITLRIQNDILKEFIARNTYIYPPRPSLRLATDLLTYCAEHQPNWLPLTICGYHIREAGATPVQEIAFSLANALAYLDHIRDRGFEVERVVPKLAAFMCVNMNFFEEIAKFRALRRLWARLLRDRYSIADPSLVTFNLVNFTAGSSLTAQQPMNNIVRVAIECLAGVLGGCQSLFPCSMDEAYCTPTESAVKVALRTQQIIAHETDVPDTIDPLGGSYFVESLTTEIEKAAMKYLTEIEKMGGAVAAIESGFFQQCIRESAYNKQKDIQTKKRIIVGVNDYIDKEEAEIPTFKPPKESAQRQIEKLKRLKTRRNNRAVNTSLANLKKAADTQNNLVPVVVEAVRNYATMGEISDVFRTVFGEYQDNNF